MRHICWGWWGEKLVNCSRAVTIAWRFRIASSGVHIVILIKAIVSHCSSLIAQLCLCSWAWAGSTVTGISQMSPLHCWLPRSAQRSSSTSNQAHGARLIKLASSINYPHSSGSGGPTKANVRTEPNTKPSPRWDSLSGCNFHVSRDGAIILFAGLMPDACKLWLTLRHLRWFIEGNFRPGTGYIMRRVSFE